MSSKLPPHCTKDYSRKSRRSGTRKLRIYYRVKGFRKIRLRHAPDTPEFWEEYAAAVQKAARRTSDDTAPGTWRWLCVRYFIECAEYMRLDQRTQRVRRAILESTFTEPIAPGSSKLFGALPLSRFDIDAIEVLRDRKLATPEAANSRLKAIRQVFKFAARKKLAASNPARDVEYFKSGSTGFHSWTVEEVQQFERCHAIGTKARLALALLLFTGQRRSDIVALGRQHLKDGWLTFTQTKNRKRKPILLSIPLRPELKATIDATPSGHMNFLVTAYNRPFTANGFGNWFRRQCNEAKLSHCSAHGLRKAAASRLAELGASENEIMAITGHTTSKEVVRYTRGARQKVLAEKAMARFDGQEKA